MISAPSSTPAAPGSTSPSRGWWIFLVRGILAVLLGVFALFSPGVTLAALVVLIGVFLILDGGVAVYKALDVVRVHASSWWLLFVAGLLGIVAGVAVFRWPGLTLLTLGYLIGLWAIVSGALEVGVAVGLRTAIAGGWWYAIFGIVSIAFGIFVLLSPGLGLVYLTYMIAFYGFVGGAALISMALRLRRSTR